MKRSIHYALSISVALMTAGTLLALAVALPTLPDRSGDRSADVAVVHGFYAALNQVIATGDSTTLDAVVWPDVTVARSDGEPWNLAAFRHHLVALHGAHPGFALQLQDVVATDHAAVAVVALEGVGSGGWIGVPGTAPTRRLATDRFRVADGRVVAYAGIVPELDVPQRLLVGEVAAPGPGFGPFGWGLARARLEPGAALPVVVAVVPILIALDAGELAVHWDGAAHIRQPTGAGASRRPREVRGRDRTWTLHAGDQISIEAGATYQVRNAGRVAAIALVTAMLPGFTPAPEGLNRPTHTTTEGAAVSEAMLLPPSIEPGTGRWPDGITVTLLAAEALTADTRAMSGQVRVAIDRLALAPWHRVEATLTGPTVLAVEAGRGIVAASKNTAADAAPGSGVSSVAAGQSVRHAPGERLVLHNLDAAPLVVLVLTLTPAAAPAEP